MRVSHGGRPRGGAARTARALTVAAAAAALVAGCSSGDGDVEATVSPLATGSPAPDKQVPVFAPSAEATAGATADAPAGVSAQASPGEQGDASADDADAAPARSLDERAEAMARELFDLANAAREQEGEEPLEWSECAAEQAVDRAGTARGKEDLEHEELEFDCEATVVGENLVRGDGPAPALHQLWMDSQGHRENIVNEDFVDLGVGCVAHATGTRTEPAEDAQSIGGWVCSQMFYG